MVEFTGDIRVGRAGIETGFNDLRACFGEWARRIEDWARELKAIYIYFDNDQAGYAAKNALRLKEMVLRLSTKAA